MPLAKQTVQFPFTKGVDLKAHPFSPSPPYLGLFENGHMLEPGSIQQRWGHSELGAINGSTHSRNLVRTQMTSGNGVTNTVFTTASITPRKGKLYLLWMHTVGRGTGAPTVVSNGGGLVWASHSSVEYKTTGVGDPETGVTRYKVRLFTAQGPLTASGTIGMTFAQTQDTIQWGIEEWDGTPSDITNGSSAIAQVVGASGDDVTSKFVTMAAYQDTLLSGGNLISTSSVSVGFGRDTNTGSFTPESGFGTRFNETSGATQFQSISADDVDDLTPSASWSTTSDVGVLAVEIKAAKGGLEIHGGGHIANVKGLARRDNELVALATTTYSEGSPKVLSWSPGSSKWSDEGFYEGVKLTETQVGQKTSDQVLGDRARYYNDIGAGVTIIDIYAWEDSGTGGTVHFQLFDGVTGIPISEERDLAGSTKRPRCMRVGDKLHVYFMSGVDFYVKVIDPVNIADTLFNSAVALDTGLVDTNTPYDVCSRNQQTESVVVYRLASAPQTYTVSRVNSAGSVSGTSVDKLREAAGGAPIAVAYEPNLDKILVVRVNNTAVPALVKADLLDGSSLADQAGDVDLTLYSTSGDAGLPLHITAAFAETIATGAAGGYHGHVFIHTTRVIGSLSGHVIYHRRIRTNGDLDGSVRGPSGTTYWQIHSGVASRAFARGSFVYVTTASVINAGTTNPFNGVYTVMRHDGLLIAKSLFLTGLRTDYNGAELNTDYLPQVEELTNDRFAFVGTFARKVSKLSDGSNEVLFADKGLMNILLDFDSPMPYRGVQLGKTLYFYGGYLAQYDGVSVTESNFLALPNIFGGGTPTSGSTGGAAESGLKDNSSYSYVMLYEWRNAFGEIERSSYIAARTLSTGAGGGNANDSNITWPAIATFSHTMKNDETNGVDRTGLAIVLYRTEANPGEGAGYFRVTSLDPSDTSGDNRFLANDTSATALASFVDSMPDATLILQEPLYLNSQELDNFPPDGGGSVMGQGQARLFVAGRDRVRYSKQWNTDDTAAFNDSLEIILPSTGGEITAIYPQDLQIYIFEKDKIYLVQGVGAPNVPDGSGYGEAQLISSDIGCVDQRTLVMTARGLWFQSAKGFCLLNGTSIDFVGVPVEDYRKQEFVVSLLLPTKNMILCVTSGVMGDHVEGIDRVVAIANPRTLMYDYLMDQWGTWTQPIGVAGVLYDGGYVVSDGPSIMTMNYVPGFPATMLDIRTEYVFDAELAWLHMAGVQGFGRCWEFSVLGEYIGSHRLRVRVSYDNNATVVDDQYWTVDSANYDVRVRPSRPKGKAIKIRLTAANLASPQEALNGTMKLVGLNFVIGTKQGVFKSSRSM